MHKGTLLLLMTFGLLFSAAMPAMANNVDTGTVGPTCSSYTITFTTSDLIVGQSYTIQWSIFGLGPNEIDNSDTFTAQTTSDTIGPLSFTIPVLSGSFAPSGTATLAEQNTINLTFSPTTLSCPGPPPPPPCQATATNSSNFNGSSVPAGDFLWFNANLDKVTHVPSGGVTISFTVGDITFTAGGTAYDIPVPNAQITFSPSATCSSTTFDSATNTWITTVPLSGDDEIFLTGVAYQLPQALVGGANPVKFTGTYSTSPSAPGLSVQMEWSVAAYSSFPTDYNAIGVKAGHKTACGQNNGDHAGTPEGVNSTNTPWKAFLIQGPRGGGGSNFTGSWSGQLNVQICAP